MNLNESVGNGDIFSAKKQVKHIEARFVVRGSKTQRRPNAGK